ncbi:MAG: 3-dehydroquinate synthase [Cyclobacteriaceae bacterium]|nr:3-dehydroquinate synthase [Cyclobacteriaceae bacterium]
MRSIQQSFSVSYEYPVYFTKGVFEESNDLLKQSLEVREALPKVLFVVDGGVASAHADLISQIQQYAEVHGKVFRMVDAPMIIPGGEACKNDQIHVDRILAAINEHGIDRHSYVVAVGGGAVLDAVGYAASIGHRGIRLIRIPTTVLSQNDSGVGVKNGINAFNKKNFLGSFTVPTAVINDSNFLDTLNIRDWRCGIAEAIKVGLVKDATFFYSIQEHADQLANRDKDLMDQLIYRCAELHIQHIASGDPFEQGSSRPLDFGHWSAHKLEQITEHQLRHGEAVAIGMALDSIYSYLDHHLTQPELLIILSLLRQLGFELYHPSLRDSQLLDGLREFQEHLGGRLTIMLLDAIGSGKEVHRMNSEIIKKSIDVLQDYHNHNSLSA